MNLRALLRKVSQNPMEQLSVYVHRWNVGFNLEDLFVVCTPWATRIVQRWAGSTAMDGQSTMRQEFHTTNVCYDMMKTVQNLNIC